MNYGYSCRATEDDNATKTAIETFLDSTGQLQSFLEQEDEDVSVEDESDKLRKKLTALFDELSKCDEEMEGYAKMMQEDRVLVETYKILELVEAKCEREGCTAERKVVQYSLEGRVMSVTYRCTEGHGGVWHSSSVLTTKRGQNVFVTSVLLSSSVLLTGNNFEKVVLLAKMLNMSFVSSATFNRIQSLYAVPVVKDFWAEMKEKIWEVFLLLCGDARTDSPGFSAKYCLYTIMDHYLDIITDVEIVDKREAGGTSAVMEKMGLKRIMERMMEKLKIKKVVTDASNVIIKLLRDLKGWFEMCIIISFLNAV